MTQLAAHLRTQRVYVEPPVDAPSPDLTDPYAAHYLAGFFSGEGSFALAPRNARIVIKLRRDDRPLLEAFRRDFGIGSVRDVATPEPWSPAAVWYAIGARDVLTAIGLFESAPLLGRKARQYEAWRPGAEAIAKAIIDKSPVDEAVVKEAREALAHATAYRPPPAQLHVDDGSSAACAAYLQVLRQWAASVDGPLSCGTYSAVRRREHPDWPKRETIAETFGSWHDALRSAGLEARAVRPRPSRLPRVEFTRLNGRADAAYRAAVVRRVRGLLRPT